MASTNEKFHVKNLFNVENWVCVVTGGATGIGLMITQALANNGATVFITSRRKDVLDNAAKTWGSNLAHPSGLIVPIVADITDKESLKSLAKEISKTHSHLDLLVNNAGISSGTSEVEKGDESAQALSEELFSEDVKAWEDVYRTNVIGHFLTASALLPLLAAGSKARPNHTAGIINISSISAITRTSQHHIKYNVSKAASEHLNKLLAQEFRRKKVNVRVNAIAPGIFPSQMTTGEGPDEDNKNTIPTGDDYGEQKGIPAGRPGAEEDMAQAALMLAVNQYAYGSSVTVDGGYLLEHP